MQLYADVSTRRARQVAGDALTAVGIALSVWAGTAMYRLIDQLAEPARAAQEAGLSVARAAGRGREAAADVPLVGQVLRQPFQALRDGGVALARAGQAQEMFVADLAWWLAILVAALPIVVLLAGSVPRRLRWIREASAAARLAGTPDGTRVLATRALVLLPLSRAAEVGTDEQALAAAALAALGLHPPPPSEQSQADR